MSGPVLTFNPSCKNQIPKKEVWMDTQGVYVVYVNMTMHACILCCSGVSDFLWPHGLKPARPLYPWNFSGKNTGAGCHFLFQGIFPTQKLNHVSCIFCIAGGFFICWAITMCETIISHNYVFFYIVRGTNQLLVTEDKIHSR